MRGRQSHSGRSLGSLGAQPVKRAGVSAPRASFVDVEPVGEDWRVGAACTDPRVDPEIFFAAPTEVEETEAAKQLCRVLCPVRFQCLAWALETGQSHGVAGGVDEGERKALRRRAARRRVKDRASEPVSVPEPVVVSGRVPLRDALGHFAARGSGALEGACGPVEASAGPVVAGTAVGPSDAAVRPGTVAP